MRYSDDIRSGFFFVANSSISPVKSFTANVSGTAITCLTFPYSRSSNVVMSAFASLTQSLPVIPTS